MILTFTDFGLAGPYLGLMKAAALRVAPAVPILDLFADVPAFDVQGAAYLLAAYAQGFAAGTVFLCVVDPGVGSAREPVMVCADGIWFVGPENGLFEIVSRRAASVTWWSLRWRPSSLSASFHGRDLFAPVAAHLAAGGDPADKGEPMTPRRRSDWPEDLARIVYIDHYGNAMTGIRAAGLPQHACLMVGRHRLGWARTFAEAPVGTAFWYENANGLVEIAVNQGDAARSLGLAIGEGIQLSL